MNLNNLFELIKFKSKYIFKNRQIVLSPLFSILIVVIYKNILIDDIENVLQIGLLFNITLSSIMMTCIPLAEDKEKKTLKTLMISTVSSTEYITATVFSPLLIVTLVNIIILFITKAVFSSFFNLIIFIVVSSLTIIVSIIIGIIMGLASKSQSQASMIAAPISMALIFIPFLGTFLYNNIIKCLSKFTYTNIIMSLVSKLGKGHIINLPTSEIVILIITLFVGFYLSVKLYKKI